MKMNRHDLIRIGKLQSAIEVIEGNIKHLEKFGCTVTINGVYSILPDAGINLAVRRKMESEIERHTTKIDQLLEGRGKGGL